MVALSCGMRGRDVRQLDDVGLGPQRQLAELGEVVADALLGGEQVGERGEHATGERDVAGLDLDAGGLANAWMIGRNE